VFVLSTSGGKKDGGHGSRPGLATKKVGPFCVLHSSPRRSCLGAAAEPHHGCVPNSATALSDRIRRPCYLRAQRVHDPPTSASVANPGMGSRTGQLHSFP